MPRTIAADQVLTLAQAGEAVTLIRKHMAKYYPGLRLVIHNTPGKTARRIKFYALGPGPTERLSAKLTRLGITHHSLLSESAKRWKFAKAMPISLAFAVPLEFKLKEAPKAEKKRKKANAPELKKMAVELRRHAESACHKTQQRLYCNAADELERFAATL